MENNTWEEGLKDALRDYQPEGLKPDWEVFADYLAIHEKISEFENDEAFDESLRESVTGYEASTTPVGWDRIESSLDLADHQFDEHIRNKISHFEAPHQPGSWNRLVRQLSGIGYLRTKLIAFKVVEAAAVILFLITVLKVGQMGKLPFESTIFDKPFASGDKNTSTNDPQLIDPKYIQSEGSSTIALNEKGSAGVTNPNGTTATITTPGEYSTEVTIDQKGTHDSLSKARTKHPRIAPITFASIIPVAGEKNIPAAKSMDMAMAENLSQNEDLLSPASTGRSFFKKFQVANFLNTLLTPVRWVSDKSVPQLAYAQPQSKTYTEFGIISQFDLNHLQIPEDRLLSTGRQIHFPQKGIPTSSLGGGFSLGVARQRWALETGVIYNAKNFKPGRNLMVGDQSNEDNSTVTFEAMRLQMLSIPLNFRYKFENKGAIKLYGVTGVGLNFIAQSDTDITIKYGFASSAGDNPNADPSKNMIIRETKKISEHFRDGAPLSTKSFLTIAGGLGMEYLVTHNKTLFLQSSIQYQVPNLAFSNNNGKNIRAISFQAGIRTPFGR